MRIQGLVRVFNHVRSRLQAGLQPGEVEAFRQQVTATVQQVEEICRQHGMTPDRLPAPSRLAYVFLKELDLDHLPITQTSEPAGVTPSFKVKNVVKIGDHFAARLWQPLSRWLASPSALMQLKREMGDQVAAIERICAQHNVTPSALEVPSRHVYCWLKFLSSEDNLALHLEALQRARDAIGEHQPRPAHPVHVHLISMQSVWRKRQYRNAVLLKVNEGFLNADQGVWGAVIHRALSGRDPGQDHLIHEFTESDDFSEVIFEMESFAAATTLSGRGRAHDLDESFDRVNAAYFAGRMSKPRLVWNRTLTAQKFGHYQPSRDTLMVSTSLDDPRVPAYMVDFVMYHELLHKQHGVTTVNGRRLAHSPGFRADERRFAEYDEAKRHLDELALRQRGLSGRIMTMEADDMG